MPVLNSERSLVDLATRISNFFEQRSESYEVIFVDDRSTNERTWKILKKLTQRPGIRAVRLTRNFGQQPATLCGMQMATGDFIVTMDDDGQHAPEDIANLLKLASHDAVIAELVGKQHSALRRIASSIKGKFDEIILGKPKGLKLSSFRLFSRGTAQAMLQLKNTPYPFLPAMMFYVTKDIVGVPIQHHARHEGRSGYSLSKMLALFKNLLINQSSLLLGFIGKVGLVVAAASFLGACYIIYRKLFMDIAIIGWTSILVTVLFIGGLVLFSLGIIGEYLIRIVGAAEKRPTFIVRDEL